jgi:hypothetical protein
MKPLNSLVVIFWHTPWNCVRVLVSTMCIRLPEGNHDSWVTCIASAECKTVITAVLTVMSGMEPHMISGNPGFGWVGLSKWILLGCGSVTVRLRDAIGTTSRRSPRCPAPPRMPPEPLPPRHHFPLLNPPLNLAPAFNGVNAINAAITPPPPGHPSLALPPAPIKG